MTVYIEYVIIDNLVADYLIAAAAVRLARVSCPWPQKLASACLGAVAAAVMPLVALNGIVVFIAKILLSLLLAAILTGKKMTLRRFLKLYAAYLGITFIMGGAALAITYFCYGTTDSNLYLVYFSQIPAGLVLGAAAVILRAVYGVFKKYFNKKQSSKFCYRVHISLCGNTLKINGFLDSGNCLFDPVENLPVFVLEACFAEKLLGKAEYENLLSGNVSDGLKKRSTRFLSFSTLGGKAQMPVLKPDKLEIYSDNRAHIINDVLIGLSRESLRLDEDCGILLHPASITF